MKDTHRIVQKLDGKEEKDREKFMVYDKTNNILFHFHITYGGREGDLATFYSRSFTGLFLQASIGLCPNKSYGTYYEFYVVIKTVNL